MAQFKQDSNTGKIAADAIVYGVHIKKFKSQLNKYNKDKSDFIKKAKQLRSNQDALTALKLEKQKLFKKGMDTILQTLGKPLAISGNQIASFQMYREAYRAELSGTQMKQIAEKMKKLRSTADIFNKKIARIKGEMSMLKAVIRIGRRTIVTEIAARVIAKALKIDAKSVANKIIKTSAKHYTKEFAKVASKAKAKGAITGIASGVNNIRSDVNLDTSRFDMAMREYVKNSKRDFVETVNRKALSIAFRSIKMTYKANVAQIRSDLNQPSSTYPDVTVAEQIVAGKLRAAGKKFTRNELKRLARKLISAKVKAAGFLRSGWLPAIKIMSRSVPGAKGSPNEKIKGKDKGGATPAKPSESLFNTQAVIFNSIQAGGNQKANKYMVDGLNMAFNAEAADMEAYLKRKMERNAIRFNTSN